MTNRSVILNPLGRFLLDAMSTFPGNQAGNPPTMSEVRIGWIYNSVDMFFCDVTLYDLEYSLVWVMGYPEHFVHRIILACRKACVNDFG
jgi:hypothetical protein